MQINKEGQDLRFSLLWKVSLNCVKWLVKAIFSACGSECHMHSAENKGTATKNTILTPQPRRNMSQRQL